MVGRPATEGPREVGARDTLRDLYLASVVEIALPSGTVAVETAPAGTATGPFPPGVAHLHVITACNPYSQVLDPADNAVRIARLAEELAAAGLAHAEAVGRAPDHSWSEPSFAVLDADEATVLDLADRHAQHAVFVWTPSEWGVLWAGAHRGERDTAGWHRHAADGR